MTDQDQTDTQAPQPASRRLRISQHTVLSYYPAKLILLLGSDPKNKINYTPDALEPGNSLYWAVTPDVSMTFGDSTVTIKPYTVVASLITWSLNKDVTAHGGKKYTDRLLTRFDCIPEDGIQASDINLHPENTISVHILAFPTSGVKFNKGREDDFDTIVPCSSVILVTDKWCKVLGHDHERFREQLKTTYASWADKVALAANQDARNSYGLEEMPDDLREDFAQLILDNDPSTGILGLPCDCNAQLQRAGKARAT